MLKDLEKIQKRSAEILGDYPEKRAELLERVKAAEEELKAAKASQESAEDLAAYDKAAEGVKRAELALKFANNALYRLDGAPRMAEADYMKALNTCREIMERATGEYRQKTTALMDQLKAVKDEYKQTAEETNSTLKKLDEAANILQSKYGRDQKGVKVKEAWQAYALRYETGKICAMATQSEEPRKTPAGVFSNDSILCAAWGAVGRAYPKHTF